MKNTIIYFIVLINFTTLVAGRIEFDLYKSKQDLVRSPSKLQESDWKNDSISLFKFLNGEYYGEVKIGSPAKIFRFMIDTTWADTWLPSSHCPWTEIVCLLHNRYDGSKSSSYIPNGKEVEIKSKDSSLSLSGFLSTDTFHLDHVKVENQTFLEATHISLTPFLQYWADGIIGLAYPEYSVLGVTPFFNNMINQGIIQEPVFTFYLNRDETTQRAGKVILGGRQRTHVKNDTLIKLDVIEKKLWKVKVDSVFATTNKTSYNVSGECNAIFDSSSNTITGPPKEIEKLNYMLNAILIPKLNRYTVNCRVYAKLPSVHFVLNGQDFAIQSKFYVQFLTLGNVQGCFSPFVPADDENQTFWELGGAFMMEFYTEFDMGKNEIWIGDIVF